MKARIVLLAVLACGLSAEAQGLIYFRNTPPTRISTNSLPGGTAAGWTARGTNLYCYALFYSTTAASVLGTTNAQMPGIFDYGVYAFEDPNWTFVAYATNLPFASGRLVPVSQNPDGTTTVNGVPGGAFAQFVVLGWSANLGSTLTDLEISLEVPGMYGWVGESAVSGPIQLGDGNLIPPSLLFGLSSPSITGFTLGVFPTVPEPSMLALVGLGLVGLFFFRRGSSV